MTDHIPDQDGWVQDADTKRRAWSGLSPTQRWEWLIDAIELAAATGALDNDRRRRAALAKAWHPEVDGPDAS